MIPSRQMPVRTIAVMVVLCAAAVSGLAAEESWAGLSLDEALRRLQDLGLRIIYSSAVVRPEMVVLSEPAANDPRGVLAEVLAPHSLLARNAPGGTIVIVAGRPPDSEPVIGTRDQTPGAPVIGAVFLDEVVVTPSHLRILEQEPETRQFLSRTEVEQMPHMADDLYRAVKRLPGATGGDYSAAFNVRGGEQQELLVLLDGVELYEPYHLKDFQNVFSIVDSAAVSGVDLLTGGYPAEFGNSMSGVMDISVEMPSAPPATTVAISTINARVHSAGAFDRGRGSWMVSARAWYPDALLNLAGAIADELLTDYYDLFAKVEHEVGRRSMLSADLLLAYDDIGYRTVDEETDEGVEAGYGSYQLWGNLRTAWSPRLSSQIVLAGGRLTRERKGDVMDIEEGDLLLDDVRSFDFIDHRQDWTLDLSIDNLFKWGIDVSWQEALYDYSRIEHPPPSEAGGYSDEGSEIIVDYEPEGWAYGVYIADRFRPLRPLVLELGLRWDRQTWVDDDQLSPRINVLLNVGERTAFRAAWGRFHQSQRLNQLQVEDGVTEFHPAQLAEHWLASVEHRFSSGIGVRVEAFHKNLSDLRPRYENLFHAIDLFPEALPDRVLIAPERGRARGVELIVKRDAGRRLSWWFSYVLSSAEDEIDARWQPRSWDQQHGATFGLNLTLPRRWNLNLGGTWHTGWPTTLVTAELVEGPDGGLDVESVLGPRNGERYPDYHRLDVRAAKHLPTTKGDLTLVIEILNLFDSRNICCTDDFELEVDDDGTVTVIPLHQYWAPIIPSVGIRYTF